MAWAWDTLLLWTSAQALLQTQEGCLANSRHADIAYISKVLMLLQLFQESLIYAATVNSLSSRWEGTSLSARFYWVQVFHQHGCASRTQGQS